MTQTQIDYFLKTYETGNIALCADELFVSRSAVSRAISDLEKEFQTELFIRTKSGVIPSEAGNMAYEVLRNINGSYLRLHEKIKELNSGALSKRIRLGMTPTNSKRIYHQFLRAFIKENPEVELIVIEDAVAKCKEMLSQGKIDLAILPVGSRPDNSSDAIYSKIPLYKNRIVFWTNTDSELASRNDLDIFDILDCPLGFLHVPMPLENTLDNCYAAYGKKPIVSVRTSSAEVLRQMVIDGIANAILPNDMFEPDDRLKSINLHFFKDCENSILWNRLTPCSENVRKLIQYISALASNE